MEFGRWSVSGAIVGAAWRVIVVIDGIRYAGSSDSVWHAIAWAWQEYVLRDFRPMPARGTDELPGDRIDELARVRRDIDTHLPVSASRVMGRKRSTDRGDSDPVVVRGARAVRKRRVQAQSRDGGSVPELPGMPMDVITRTDKK